MESFLHVIADRARDAEGRGRQAEFLAWCNSRAIDSARVTLTDSADEGCGLVASKPLAADEAIISVPLSAALMAGVNGPLADVFMQLEPTHALALALTSATSAGDGGDVLDPWTAYWPPAAVGGWGFTDAEWASLAWCAEAETLHSAQEAAARKAFDEVITPHFGARVGGAPDEIASSGGAGLAPSWARFKWALSMVSSRAASLNVSGDSRLAIIPLVDLLNHRMTPSAYLAFDAEGAGGAGAFVVRAYAPLAAGATLTICYGDKENADLLVSYGFAQRRNPFDTASVRVEVPADHLLIATSSFRAFAPQGALRVFDAAARGGIVMGALEWHWDDSMYDERPVDVDESLVLHPALTQPLSFVVALACAKEMGLMAAFGGSGWAAGRLDAELLDQTSPEVVEAIHAACAATLHALPPEGTGDRQSPLRVALEARRALLAATVAAFEAAGARGASTVDE